MDCSLPDRVIGRSDSAVKLLILKHPKTYKNRLFGRPVNFERVLYIAFLSVFVLLLGTQAILINPNIRSAVTISDDMKGTPLGAEEFLYSEGTMELKLLDGSSIPELKVLVNGEERACFSENIVTISLIDGDVVEIDGSGVGGPAEVAVSSVSSNMDSSYVGLKLQVEGNIKKVAKVKVSDK